MIIYIKLIDNSKFKLDVDINSSVLQFKKKIEKDLKIEVDKQRLIYDGSPMSDEICLWKYNLRENSTINLIIQMMTGL